MSDTEKNNLPEPLEQLPPELLQKLEERGLTTSLKVQHISSGPIPSPQELEHYEKIHEGFADRIVTMAEREQNHRHKIEDSGLNMEGVGPS